MKKMQADDHTTTSSGQETTGKKTGKKHQRVIMRVLVGVMMIVSCVSVSMLLFVIIYKNIPWTHPEFAVFFFLVINAVLAIGFIGRIIKNRMLYSILIIALFGANICLSLYGIFQGGFWINIGLLVFEEAIHGFGFGFSISLLAKDNNAWLSFYEIIRTSNTTDLTRVETPLGLCDLVRITKMLIRSHQLYGSLDSKTRIFTRVANPIVPVTIIKAKVNVPQRDNKKKQRNQDKGKAPSTPVAKSIAILEHELALDKTIAVKDVVRQLKVGLDEAKALLDALNEPTSYSEEDVAGLKALATTVLQQVAEPTLLDVLRMPGCSSVKAAKALGKYLLDEGIIERFPRHGGKTAISESRQPAILPEEKPSCVVCKGTIAGINYECPGCGARHHIGCAAALKASQGGC
nr:hypothetical protein [Candidatus Sigynarchaeota archaeon]